MCCGTAQNSYQTLAGMRVMLADGTLLTEGPAIVQYIADQAPAAKLARVFGAYAKQDAA